MGGDVPGKPMVFVGVIMGMVLLYMGAGGTLSYVLWGLAILLVVIGLINWSVK